VLSNAISKAKKAGGIQRLRQEFPHEFDHRGSDAPPSQIDELLGMLELLSFGCV